MPRACCLFVVLACLTVATTTAAEEATPAGKIEIHDGFAVERILSVPRALGSWVAFCFDTRGRIYASDQGPRLFRITPPPIGSAAEPIVEVVSDVWGHSQGMAFIDGALYSVQHGDHNPERFRPDLLLRIRDSDGDDRLDAAETLIEFPRASGDAANWYEHSYHAVIPAPDGQSIYLVSGDRNGLPGDRTRTPKLWNRDSWEFPFTDTPFCGGWVARADLDGRNLEVVCMGLRNGYDLAFDRQGDLFTFDSDLENDFGLPNYRPTAIRQILSGSDSGWGGRAGEMLWSWKPDWEEIQPPILDIGPGSPTGICFGHDAAFPPRYREALFACDWSYGRMFAIHLEPHGATHSAEAEPFLSAQGLPIADVAVSPTDHALYFLTGGRGTQSGLYRVTATGAPPAATSSPAPDDATTTPRRRFATCGSASNVFMARLTQPPSPPLGRISATPIGRFGPPPARPSNGSRSTPGEPGLSPNPRRGPRSRRFFPLPAPLPATKASSRRSSEASPASIFPRSLPKNRRGICESSRSPPRATECSRRRQQRSSSQPSSPHFPPPTGASTKGSWLSARPSRARHSFPPPLISSRPPAPRKSR